MVVGSSVGALNGAYYAGDSSLNGVLQLEAIWRGLTRHDVFPITWRTLLGFIRHRDFLIPHDGIPKLVDDNLPYRNLQDAKLPVHIVTTDIVSGNSVVLSEGSAAAGHHRLYGDPQLFAPVRYKDFYLADGAILEQHTDQGRGRKGREPPDHSADRICLFNAHAPTGAVANALHALTLLIARQLVSELEDIDPSIEYFVVPPLCPLMGSP